MTNDSRSPESLREDLMQRAYATPDIARALEAFRQATLRVPPVQSVATTQVRFTTGAN